MISAAVFDICLPLFGCLRVSRQNFCLGFEKPEKPEKQLLRIGKFNNLHIFEKYNIFPDQASLYHFSLTHSLNMDTDTLDTGLHTTIINLWKTNMNSFWTVFWLQEKKSTFCLPTLFFFPPAEIWHWIVFFLIFLWYQQERVPFVLPHGLQARVFQLFRSLSWGTWRKIRSPVLHQQLKARLTFWRGWGTSDAMPPYISRESPLLSPASHSEILDPRSAPWEFCIFFNVFCLSHNAVGILLLPQNCHLVLRWQKLSGSGGWSPGDVEKWKRNRTITKER